MSAAPAPIRPAGKRPAQPPAPATGARREETREPQSPESLRVATLTSTKRPGPPPPAAPPSAPPSPPGAPAAKRVVRRACGSTGCGRREEELQPPAASWVVRRCPACGGALSRGEHAPGGCTCPTGRAADAVADTLRGGGGAPLAPSTRAWFEERYGHDLGGVRVHTGAQADQSARAVDALAYTVGSDVVFRSGYFAPSTQPGQRLLAHELAHVVQQDRGGARRLATASAGALEIGRADDPLEREADRAAAAALSPSADVPALSADGGTAVRRISLGFLEDAWDATGGRAVGAVGDAASWAGGKIVSGAEAAYEGAQYVGGKVVEGAEYVGGKVVEGAEWVGEKAEQAYEWTKDQLARVVEYLAPGLLDFLRGDVLGLIRDKIAGAITSLFGGLAARVSREGVVGALSSLLGEAAAGIASAAEGLGGAACDMVLNIASAVGGFIKSFTGPLFGAVKTAAGAVADFFSTLWNKLGKPAVEAIESLAGSAWTWIKDKAAWLWDISAPIRDTVSAAWEWLLEQFGLAWNAAGSVFDWLVEKAKEAWAAIMSWIEPILGPLKVIGGILLMLSPLGPVVAIGAGGYALYRGLKWLWENWNDLSIVVTARKFLSEELLPALRDGIAWMKEKLSEAMAWLSGTLGSLVEALGSLMEALGVNALLSGLASLVGSVRGFFVDVAGWIAETLAPVVQAVGSVLSALWSFLRPVLEITAKLVFIANNPWIWPMVITGWAWRILPDCIKGPVIDWVLDVMIWAVNALPDFQGLGEWWAQGKQKILEALTQAKGMSMEGKIQASDRVAKIMTLEDLGWLWSMIDAARKAPGEFEGQVEEELLGADLTKPFPFERGSTPSATDAAAIAAPAALTGMLSTEDLSVLQRPHLTDNDVTVDAVAPLDLPPELVEQLAMEEGATREFGENPDPSASLAAIRKELSAPEAGGDVAASAEGEEAAAEPAGPPLSHEEETEKALQAMMDQPGPQTCDAEPKDAEAAAKSGGEIPESSKIGPLTRGQRGRYLLNQMWKGIKQWFSCNAHWLIPTLIVAAIALIAAEILTGGAVTAALPVIMEVMAVIFIGVAVVRGAWYVGEYVAKSLQGDTAGAAKSLARAVAIAVVELVFALMFEVGRLIKMAKNAALTAMKGASRVAKSAGRGLSAAGHAVAGSRVGRAVVGGAKAVAGVTRRTAGAALRQGKIVMKGVGEGIGRGVRSLDDLARRLWQRVRFRRFRLRIQGGWFVLEGYINPWILLASGRVREWHGPRTTLGEEVLPLRGKSGYIVGIVDEGGKTGSAFVRDLDALSTYELRNLYRDLRNAADEAARRELILGARMTAENAKELRKAMKAAGKVAAAGDHAHHIVPSTHRLGQAARDVLDDLKIGINSSHNGVFVDDVIHGPLHTKKYMAEVERLILLADASATTRAARIAAVEKQLDAIAALIKKGKFP